MGKVSEAVRFIKRSDNRKLGRCAATYVSQNSCPKDCPFRGKGCYAEAVPTFFTTAAVNRAGRHTTRALALEESRQIDAAPGDRPLRVHVVGDSPNDESARIVGAAMVRYAKRSSQPAWTYTHAWRVVRRSSWGRANVLASCESATDVRKARRKGYATALVVSHFASDKTHEIEGLRVIPCPNQTRGVTCSDCQLCANPSRLRRHGLTIGFALHGRRAQSVNARGPGRIALTVV